MVNSFRAIVFSVSVSMSLLLMDGAKGADPVEADTEASAQVSACAKCEGCIDAASHCPVRTASAEEVASAVTATKQTSVSYSTAALPVAGTTVPLPTISKQGLTQVMFNILVVQDTSKSFQEFVELQQTSFMMADTQMIRGTLCILEKNKLIKKLARPQMMVTVGTEGTLDVSRAPSGGSEPWQSLRLKLLANELRGGLSVDFELEYGLGKTTSKVKTSTIVPTGQSVLMGPIVQDESQLYVVLITEIVKAPVERAAMIPPVRTAEK